MSDNNRVYLAGTIYDEEPGSLWKVKLCEQFVGDVDHRFEFIDPDPTNECDLTMVPRDKAAINSSDVLVAYIEHASVGTSMEIYHAYLRGDIPIIIICPNDFCRGNIWLEAHVHCIVDNVIEAANYIKSLQF